MSNLKETEGKLQIVESQEFTEVKEEEASTSGMSGDRTQKRAGRRPGRRSSKMDVRAKLERSRQSARECRARKKLRYQYLEDLVANREKAVFALRDELEMFKQWCIQVDSGLIPMALLEITDNSRSDEVSPKRIRLEKIPEDGDVSEDVKDSNYRTLKLQERMDIDSDNSVKTNGHTKSFKGSNSDVSVLSKGGNSKDNRLNSATGSIDDELVWFLDGDIFRIEQRTKDSVLKGSNSVLPTIVEESD